MDEKNKGDFPPPSFKRGLRQMKAKHMEIALRLIARMMIVRFTLVIVSAWPSSLSEKRAIITLCTVSRTVAFPSEMRIHSFTLLRVFQRSSVAFIVAEFCVAQQLLGPQPVLRALGGACCSAIVLGVV
jgi:hypothetical protein